MREMNGGAVNGAGAEAPVRAEVLSLAAVEEQEVSWLWEPYLWWKTR